MRWLTGRDDRASEKTWTGTWQNSSTGTHVTDKRDRNIELSEWMEIVTALSCIALFAHDSQDKMTDIQTAEKNYGQKSFQTEACIWRKAHCTALTRVHLLICSLRTARFVELTRSFARSLTHSRAHGKEIFVYEFNASYSLNSEFSLLIHDYLMKR